MKVRALPLLVLVCDQCIDLPPDEALVARLKAATKQPGSVPTREIMRSVITVEQAKAKVGARGKASTYRQH